MLELPLLSFEDLLMERFTFVLVTDLVVLVQAILLANVARR